MSHRQQQPIDRRPFTSKRWPRCRHCHQRHTRTSRIVLVKLRSLSTYHFAVAAAAALSQRMYFWACIHWRICPFYQQQGISCPYIRGGAASLLWQQTITLGVQPTWCSLGLLLHCVSVKERAILFSTIIFVYFKNRFFLLFITLKTGMNALHPLIIYLLHNSMIS